MVGVRLEMLNEVNEGYLSCIIQAHVVRFSEAGSLMRGVRRYRYIPPGVGSGGPS